MEDRLNEYMEDLLKVHQKEQVLEALNYLADLDENEMLELVEKVKEIEETTNQL